MASLSGCDSFPLGKCPLKWHSSPFPSGSVLSEPSAERVWNHPGHTHMVSQLSHRLPLGESGALCANHALQKPQGRKAGGLNVFQSLAQGPVVPGTGLAALPAPPPPPNKADSGFQLGGDRRRLESAVFRSGAKHQSFARLKLCPGTNSSLYWARLIWGVRSFIKLALPLSLYSSTCLTKIARRKPFQYKTHFSGG